MPCYLTTCESVARAAGDVLRQWQGKITVREKAKADLVTEADLASQELIRGLIAAEFPDHEFLGEEGDTDDIGESAGFLWVVDPLDGTTNYVHGLPGWCVSVGLVRDGKPIAGCVYDPERDVCYTAQAGQGAFENGNPIATSSTGRLEDSLVAISFPASIERNSPEIEVFLRLLPKIRAFRRLGSAALNLCYLACGKIDAYWTGNIKPWDVAAGVLILQESGGTSTTMYGEEHSITSSTLAAAATGKLHSALIRQISPTIR